MLAFVLSLYRRAEGLRTNLNQHLVPYHGKCKANPILHRLYLFICINRGPHARHRNFGPGK